MTNRGSIFVVVSFSLVLAFGGFAQQPAKKPAKSPAKAAPTKEPVPAGLFPVRVNDKWGYIDGSGKIAIAPQFAEAAAFSEGLAAVKQDGKWGYIETDGKLVIAADFKKAEPFAEGIAAVQGDRLWNFITKDGKALTPRRYMSAKGFDNGLGWARSEDGWDGFVDAEGKFTTYRQYEWVYPLSDGLSLVTVKKKCGFIDRTGTLVIPAEIDCNAFQFTGIGGGGGLAEMRYVEKLGHFSEGLAAFAIDKKWGYIDKTGQTVIPLQFTSTKVTPAVQDFSEGLAAVSVDDKWGFIDKAGKFRIEPRFDSSPGRFSQDRAAVQMQGKWGFVDSNGKMVIAPQFDKVEAFSNGLARVWLGEKLCYINRTGKLIWQPPA